MKMRYIKTIPKRLWILANMTAFTLYMFGYSAYAAFWDSSEAIESDDWNIWKELV